MLSEYNRKKSSESDMALSLAREELDSTAHKISKIVQFIMESDLSLDTVREEMRQLEAKKRSLEAQIKEIAANYNASAMSEVMIAELVRKFKDSIQNNNFQGCRQFLHSFVEKVVSFRDRVEIFFQVHLPNHDNNIFSQLKSMESKKTLREDYKRAG
jgi:septal ring factor EnvC (AmiA/AmiB activator)